VDELGPGGVAVICRVGELALTAQLGKERPGFACFLGSWKFARGDKSPLRIGCVHFGESSCV